MKKKRFSLLTKIILLTGILTILTVGTSLTVNLLISRNATRDSYRKSCEDVTDSIESAFFPTAKLTEAKSVANMLVNEYENNYGPLTCDAMNKNPNDWDWNDSPWPWEVTK